jgi:hypothetical protein
VAAPIHRGRWDFRAGTALPLWFQQP